MDIQLLCKVIEENKSIELFENSKTQGDFWDNEHISKMMLMAHLNPSWDAASRKADTIENTCQWLVKQLDLTEDHKVLDLGCGPGLYASRLTELGLNMMGIDYSKRSLDYARDQAKMNNQPIEYIYQDYLELDYEDEFDAITLIYCDFGVLSNDKRRILLGKIHKALKPGGVFICDVWSNKHTELTETYKNWVIHEKQGFWKATPHLELIIKDYYMDDQVSLKQHIIIENGNVLSVYNLWEQCYTKESLIELMTSSGFQVASIVGDLTGKLYDESSDTIGIMVRK